jgi:hypothetical protein
MQTIVFICIPVFILSILANNGIIPPTAYAFITGIILVIGIVIIGKQILDLSNRDNMNWDEYNWYFDKSKAPPNNADGSQTASDPWAIPSLTCIGADCCYEGSTYDSVQNICVPTTTGSTTGSETTGITTSGTTTTGSGTTTTGTTTTGTTTTGTETGTTESFKGLGKYGYFSVK